MGSILYQTEAGVLTSSVGGDGTNEEDATVVGASVTPPPSSVPAVEGDGVGRWDTPPPGTGGPSEFVPIETAGVGGGVKPVSSTGSGGAVVGTDTAGVGCGVKPVSSTGSSTDGEGVGDVTGPEADGTAVGALPPVGGWAAPEWDGDAVGWFVGLLCAVVGTGACEGAWCGNAISYSV